jgi:predicted nucleic acid-binding protein
VSVVQPAPVLLGFSQLDYGSRGFISNPIISDINESLLAELRDLGLKQMDARAVVFAVTTECDYFVTHDTRDLLPHRDAIEAKRQIRIVKPTEFLPEWRSRA